MIPCRLHGTGSFFARLRPHAPYPAITRIETRMPRKVSKKFAAAFGSSPEAGDEASRRDRDDAGAGVAGVSDAATAPVPTIVTASSATEKPPPASGRPSAPDTFVRIDLARQRLDLRVRGGVCRSWPVSTAANGPGEREGSECTPRGNHVVRAKIGAGAAPGAVFVARRPTGERYTPALGAAHPERDWILTRILWLSGTEPGRNRLGGVDTMRRYIYIHGCPDEVDITTPGSHGCIRMRNDDVIDLFDRVETGTKVLIEA